jgi:hypothetical protein
MTGRMRTIVTADDFTVDEGSRVFNYYDGEWGTIGRIGNDGWFDHIREDGSRGSLLNGDRVCYRIPRSNPYYAEFSSGNPPFSYQMDYPVPVGRTVYQGHVDACAKYGHATYIKDRIVQGYCPRCGEITEN